MSANTLFMAFSIPTSTLLLIPSTFFSLSSLRILFLYLLTSKWCFTIYSFMVYWCIHVCTCVSTPICSILWVCFLDTGWQGEDGEDQGCSIDATPFAQIGRGLYYSAATQGKGDSHDCKVRTSSNSRSKANFSFQFMTSCVWYSMEKLAGNLLFGLKLVKLSVLSMLFIQFA